MGGRVVLGEKAFPATVASVRDARRFVAETLPPEERRDTAVLLVSECFTNGVLHSDSRFGGEIAVALLDVGGVLRVEVVDAGGDGVPLRRHGDAPRENGYGVLLVEELARAAGHFVDCAGRRCVWFEVV